MELSQIDLDKIKAEYDALMKKLQWYLVGTYDSLSRIESNKLIWEQLKKLIGT